MLLTSARLFQHSLESKRRVFELRVAEHTPVLMDVCFKEFMNVAERERRVLPPV